MARRSTNTRAFFPTIIVLLKPLCSKPGMQIVNTYHKIAPLGAPPQIIPSPFEYLFNDLAAGGPSQLPVSSPAPTYVEDHRQFASYPDEVERKFSEETQYRQPGRGSPSSSHSDYSSPPDSSGSEHEYDAPMYEHGNSDDLPFSQHQSTSKPFNRKSRAGKSHVVTPAGAGPGLKCTFDDDGTPCDAEMFKVPSKMRYAIHIPLSVYQVSVDLHYVTPLITLYNPHKSDTRQRGSHLPLPTCSLAFAKHITTLSCPPPRCFSTRLSSFCLSAQHFALRLPSALAIHPHSSCHFLASSFSRTSTALAKACRFVFTVFLFSYSSYFHLQSFSGLSANNPKTSSNRKARLVLTLPMRQLYARVHPNVLAYSSP
jgi:hypothetical protein